MDHPRNLARRVIITVAGALMVAPFAWVIATRPKDPPPPRPPPEVAPPSATKVTDLPTPESTSTEAADAFRLGLQAFRSGAVHEATRQYALAVADDPGLAAAHLRLAFLDDGEPDGERRHYDAALNQKVALTPRDQAVLDAIEPRERELPDGAEVVKRLLAALGKWRFDAELLWLLGVAYYDEDARSDDALAMWARAVTVDPEFATPLWSRARALLERGGADEAKETLDKCLAVSPGATSCLDVRALLEMHEGNCAAMEADARAMAAAEPEGERAYGDLARALAAEGMEHADAVRQALAQKWAATPEPRRTYRALFDAVDVALWTGDLDEADRELTVANRAIGEVPAPSVHSEHARRAILLDEETGREAQAAEVARAFLARRRAFTGDAGAVEDAVELDAVPLALAALVRAGAMSNAQRTKEVGAWHDASRARLGARSQGMLWFAEHGTPTTTADDARLGLAALPDSSPLPEWYAFVSADAEVGKLRFLAGDVDAALPLLRRGAAACNVLDQPIEHARVELMLGLALEKTGDTAGACDAYTELVSRWSSAKASVTLAAARARLSALSCGR